MVHLMNIELGAALRDVVHGKRSLQSFWVGELPMAIALWRRALEIKEDLDLRVFAVREYLGSFWIDIQYAKWVFETIFPSAGKPVLNQINKIYEEFSELIKEVDAIERSE